MVDLMVLELNQYVLHLDLDFMCCADKADNCLCFKDDI